MKDEQETFTSILHTIAEKTIPKTSAVPRKLNKPWWTEECQEVYIQTTILALKWPMCADVPLNHIKIN